MVKKIEDTGCCAPFDPTPWDGKTFVWKNKRFVKASVFTFFYMPLNFGRVITKLFKKVVAAKAVAKSNLCLSDHTSKWNMDIYVEVTKEVPGAENVLLSGKFMSKVYEGDYKDTEKWCKDFEKWVWSKKYKIKKWYMWYTTCPKCAKAYGKNYTVIMAEIKEPKKSGKK